ncbi:MAG: TonB family protein [Planctomycetes bacterium]|nr:TonB family protein [Planctomycetota bacterium]
MAEQTADAMAGFGEASLGVSAGQHAVPAAPAKLPASARIDPAVRAWSLSLVFHGSLILLVLLVLNVPKYLGKQDLFREPLTVVSIDQKEQAALPDLPVPQRVDDSIQNQFSIIEQPEIPEVVEEDTSDPVERALNNDFPTIQVLPGESAVSLLSGKNAHPVSQKRVVESEAFPNRSRAGISDAPPAAPASSGPSGYVPPAPRTDLRPAYPASQKRLGRIATVGVELQIDERGRFTDLKVLTSAVHDDFIEAIRQAAQRARFTPATQDGRAVASTLAVNFQFRLR